MAEHAAVFADARLGESEFVFFARIVTPERRSEFQEPVTAIEFFENAVHRLFALFFIGNTRHNRPTLRVYPYFGTFVAGFAEFQSFVGNGADVPFLIEKFIVYERGLRFYYFVVFIVISARNLTKFFHLFTGENEHLGNENAFAFAFFADVGQHIVPVRAEH